MVCKNRQRLSLRDCNKIILGFLHFKFFVECRMRTLQRRRHDDFGMDKAENIYCKQKGMRKHLLKSGPRLAKLLSFSKDRGS